MKTIGVGLQAILDSGRFYVADCYTFTLKSGTVLRYTSGPGSVADDLGNTFAVGPLIERSTCSWSVGIDVDTLELTISPRSTDLVEGVAFRTAIMTGLFDGAEVEVKRAFMSVYGNASNGCIVLFAGSVADVDIGQSRIEMTVNHFVEKLNIQMPRNLYQPGCLWTVYDTGCGVVRASYTFAYTVGSGATTTQIPVPSTSKDDHYFDQGVLTVGGVSRRIVVWDLDTAVVTPPLPSAPTAGTAVTMVPGCNRTLAECTSKFANEDRYRGFPFIPQPEAAV
jgi:uncharacterized phage protein (TIGR02218 family)